MCFDLATKCTNCDYKIPPAEVQRRLGDGALPEVWLRVSAGKKEHRTYLKCR